MWSRVVSFCAVARKHITGRISICVCSGQYMPLLLRIVEVHITREKTSAAAFGTMTSMLQSITAVTNA